MIRILTNNSSIDHNEIFICVNYLNFFKTPPELRRTTNYLVKTYHFMSLI